MTNRRNWNVAMRVVKARIVGGIAALLLVSCGGGGAEDGGGGSCPAGTSGRSHALACSTNGLPPDALDGDGLGFLVGLGFQETSPTDRATGVSVTAVVRVTFNKAMATAPSVVVTDPAGRTVMGSVVLDGANVRFTPEAPLSPTVTYTVVVDGGRSVDGDDACGFLGMAGRCHLEFSFTTS